MILVGDETMIRVCHNENKQWKPINTEQEIKEFLESYDFNASQIAEMYFTRSMRIVHTDASVHIPDALVLIFDKNIDITECAVIKRIEVLFGNLDKLSFCPENIYDVEFIDQVKMEYIDGLLYFGDTGFGKLNKQGYNDEAMWLRCEKAFWREIDYSVDV